MKFLEAGLSIPLTQKAKSHFEFKILLLLSTVEVAMLAKVGTQSI